MSTKVKARPAKTKKCGKCNKNLPRAEFYRSTASPDGLQHRCKACMKKYQRARARKQRYLASHGPSPLDKASFVHLLHCRRAGQDVSESDITPEYLLDLWRTASRCPDCNKPFSRISGRPGSKNLDHIRPISRGGKHMRDNVRIVCRTCNLRKGDQLPRDRDT